MKAKMLLAVSFVLLFGLIQFLRLDQPENTSGADGTESYIPREKRVPAPLFVLHDLKGRKVALDQYKGRVVFLGFWTTW